MKMNEFGPPGGARPWRPPLDPPMEMPQNRIFEWLIRIFQNINI